MGLAIKNQPTTISPSFEEKSSVTTMSLPAAELSSQKSLYDAISLKASKDITKKYSTSFSIGILCLDRSIRDAIYQIYGFVRVADEIVDSFHGYEKEVLLDEFELETFKSIERAISTNPVLNSFQLAVNRYNINLDLIKSFLYSMRMDLNAKNHDKTSYDTYIYGSAEVVGLMCLYVFVDGRMEDYIRLKPKAMKLGSAFQKINFLRDIKEDSLALDRVYFPHLDLTRFDNDTKNQLLEEIELEFEEALNGIRELPATSQFGVYVAYLYYKELCKTIRQLSAKELLIKRARVSTFKKTCLLLKAYLMRKFNFNI
jgi:phytoene/squalene synthetase